ncbi:MAG: hypothetical protein JNM07_06095 [Phycisphaerae bacterium]|nr:hypothetical protein [Phycisphaerae bacterium]
MMVAGLFAVTLLQVPPIPTTTAPSHAAHTPTVLRVGPGQTFDRPERALEAAHAGDTIELLADDDHDLVISGAALRVQTPNLTIRGRGVVVLDGRGFEYSGVGQVPRAIIQVEASAPGVTIANLVLRNAHNETGNGAGIRINAADACTILGCEITGCDMGVMSNGGRGEAKAQRIEGCRVHANGSTRAVGLSHNLYLSGDSVTLETSRIESSTTGHNLKSRARFLAAFDCAFSGAAEREIDLVDSDLTVEPGADALLERCAIEKKPDSAGNRDVIHFGRDGSCTRRGTLALRDCVITTSYISPVVRLSTPDTSCLFERCRITNEQQHIATLVECAGDARAGRVRGTGNVLSPCYDASQLQP